MEAFLKEGAALVVAVDINAEKLKELTSERKYPFTTIRIEMDILSVQY